jgi:hypothetical protein
MKGLPGRRRAHTEVIMSSHTAPFGFDLHSLRTLRHTPQVAHTRAVADAAPTTTWLERLAGWAERQPLHHRMGSCGCL